MILHASSIPFSSSRASLLYQARRISDRALIACGGRDDDGGPIAHVVRTTISLFPGIDLLVRGSKATMEAHIRAVHAEHEEVGVVDRVCHGTES